MIEKPRLNFIDPVYEFYDPSKKLSVRAEAEGWEKYRSSRPSAYFHFNNACIDARHIWSNSAIEIGSMNTNTNVCRLQATRMGPVSPFLCVYIMWARGSKGQPGESWIHGHFFALTLWGDSDFLPPAPPPLVPAHLRVTGWDRVGRM